MKIGFIGLGIMGKPMAKNLIKAGHELVVTDIVKEAVAEVEACGAARRGQCPRSGPAVRLIITMLPNSPHVKQVVCGENGVLEGAKPGAILVDMSSIAPARVPGDRQGLRGKRRGSCWMRPYRAASPRAIDGTLSIMVGGDEKVFRQVYDILMVMGASAVYCGEIGAGNTTKLANQVVVAVNIAAVAEAFMLSKKAGVDPELVYKAIRGGLAGSTVMDAKGPMMLAGNTKPASRSTCTSRT